MKFDLKNILRIFAIFMVVIFTFTMAAMVLNGGRSFNVGLAFTLSIDIICLSAMVSKGGWVYIVSNSIMLIYIAIVIALLVTGVGALGTGGYPLP